MRTHVILATCLLLSVSAIWAQAPTPRVILDKMYSAIDGVKRASYVMTSRERFGGKNIDKRMRFHVNESPKKVYMKDLDAGIELLYAKGWNNEKAYINPNGFPWTNVSLSIHGGQVRKESHHLVTMAGFAFTAQLLRGIEAELTRRGEKIEKYFTYLGDITFDGRSCYKLLIEYKDFKYVSHTVAREEELHTLCNRLGVPEYLVMEKNGLGYGSVSAGKTLQVPNAYCKSVTLWIDKKTNLPIVQILFDDKGLYEKYEYTELQVNPSFPSDEWTENCPRYGF